MLVIFFTEVHPFGSVTAESIAVDLVAPDEAPGPLSSPKREPSDSFDLSSTAAPGGSPPAAAQSPVTAQQAVKPSPKQAALSQPKPTPSPVSSPALNPAPRPESNPAPNPAQNADRQPSSPSPAYTAPQPDLSIKYQVLLGLPVTVPQGGRGDDFDAPATQNADLAFNPIAEFRRHLKTCSMLPKSIDPSDKVAIKLRVLMTPDGRLATDPSLIEASASVKGPLLMESAISALQACQPYTMLPPDEYNEWKIIDINFTPQDFGSAS